MKKKIIALLLSLTVSLLSTVCVVFAEDVTAKIGENKYVTLSEAINAATDGQTIELVKDCNETIEKTITSSITIHGHGNKMTGQLKLNGNGTNDLTVNDLWLETYGIDISSFNNVTLSIVKLINITTTNRYGFYDAILVQESNNVTIENCEIHGADEVGINCRDIKTNLLITNNYIEETKHNSIQVVTGNVGNKPSTTITQNTFVNWGCDARPGKEVVEGRALRAQVNGLTFNKNVMANGKGAPEQYVKITDSTGTIDVSGNYWDGYDPADKIRETTTDVYLGMATDKRTEIVNYYVSESLNDGDLVTYQNHTITFVGDGDNTLSGSVTSGASVAPGTEVTVTGNPATGYQFDCLEFDRISSLKSVSVSGNTYTFTMPNNDVTVFGYFSTPIDEVVLDIELPTTASQSFTPTVNSDKYSIIESGFITSLTSDPISLPLAKGTEYFMFMALKANEGYSFKYTGPLFTDYLSFANKDDIYAGYGVSVNFNGIAATKKGGEDPQQELEALAGPFYFGDPSFFHDILCIYYKFTPQIGYEVINGENAVIDSKNIQDTLFRSDAEYSTFFNGTDIIAGCGVKVDDDFIDPSNYEHEKGSIKITLKSDYLKTLALGTHKIDIVSTDGYATTNFTISDVKPPKPRYKVPNTGVSEVTEYSLLKLSTLSLLTIGTYVVLKKKKDN